ncbi:MAG: hypothetical protein MUC35_05905 [Candidatus Margulisbacteria bacterium]|nr:hypothetical protein [Candidatus Margulisiibacteriota bacterium]
MDRFARLAVDAALVAAGRKNIPSGTGVVVATLTGPRSSTKEFLRDLKKHGPAHASALRFPHTVLNLAAGMVSIALGLRGPVVTVIGRLNEAVQIAAGMIEYRQAPAFLVGFVDEGSGAEFLLLRSAKGKKRG